MLWYMIGAASWSECRPGSSACFAPRAYLLGSCPGFSSCPVQVCAFMSAGVSARLLLCFSAVM